MSKNKKKEKKQKGGENMKNNNQEINDLSEDLFDAVADERLASAYVALYIVLFAFIITVLMAFFFMNRQYQMLAELMKLFSETTAIHVPVGEDVENITGSISTW